MVQVRCALYSAIANASNAQGKSRCLSIGAMKMKHSYQLDLRILSKTVNIQFKLFNAF